MKTKIELHPKDTEGCTPCSKTPFWAWLKSNETTSCFVEDVRAYTGINTDEQFIDEDELKTLKALHSLYFWRKHRNLEV